jgi:calpain-15
MCALASLAERPKLVEKLFLTKEINKEGVYRIQFCKNGSWQEVTIDDYFPCLPCGGPMFSRAHGNESWVLLIEKAYAKIHGNYFTLRGGFANEGMIDLTGCPSSTYDFTFKKVLAEIESGSLFNKML